MVHIFNRIQLLADFDISLAAQAREVLKQNGVELAFKKKQGDAHAAYGQGGEARKVQVYIIYVQKKDAQKARQILHDAKLL